MAATKIELLENGVWVATESLPHLRSVNLGVYLDTGSRDETPANGGLAHFFEHMVFKGTPRLDPLDIVRRFEATGGQINAYTTREQTCFYGKVVDTAVDGALDVLLDMVFAAKFDADDIRKEKDVVIEEIRSVNDSPDELSYELFGEAAYGPHAVGRPIAGTEKTVRGLTAAALRRHRDEALKTTPVAVIAVGRVDHAAFAARVRKYFGLRGAVRARRDAPLQASRTTARPAARAPLARTTAEFQARHIVRPRDVNQATVILGGPACPWSSPDRFPLLLLHCALGDGMSSRLFQNLREKHGLVYSIFSSPEFLSREGLFSIGFATDPKQVGKAVHEIGRELARMRRKGLTKKELQEAKDNVKGGILLGLESTGSRMSALARRLLGDPREENLKRVLQKIDAVTQGDILRCAREYLQPARWASAAVVPKGFKTDLGALLQKA
ncbi:MAG: ptrA [Fibrobacteria bacterium]|nr:ptrA [Fibrobacteria bacterium]